jgi:uncharacterized protein
VRQYQIPVLALLNGSRSIARFDFEATMPGLKVTSAWVEPNQPIRVNGQVEAAGEGLMVHLAVATQFRGECVRCLKQTSGELRADARELFKQGPTTDDYYGFRGEYLDLSQIVHDQVVLALPLLPLCSSDCKGLCQWCGSDLNETQCNCLHDRQPSPFDILG